MEVLFDDYQINTIDIWPIEAQHYLAGNRTEEQTYRLKSILETLIIKTRKGQIQLNKTVTILPFVTLSDYYNNTNKDLWLKHVQDFAMAKCLRDHVRLDYFSFLDKGGLDSCFLLQQDMIIDRKNDDFDLWFVLKLGQYKEGLMYLNEFLKYQLQESFQSDIEKYNSFLHILIKQYKNEFLNEELIELTIEWLSKNYKKRELAGQVSTYYLKKVKNNPYFLDTGDALICIQEILFSLKTEKFIKENTAMKSFMKLFKGKALDENEKIIWVGIKVELKWFVELIIQKDICVEINKIDKWIIAQNCFLCQKKDGTIEAINDYLSISEARGDKTHRKEILNKILEKLNKIGNATPTE
jgi:hypothetical protein